jgi:hypothetical protein
MYFSDWSGDDSQGNIGELNMQNPPLIPEPPVQYTQPNIQPPQEQLSDPNATPLTREHFRTSRDNSIPNTGRSIKYKEYDSADDKKCDDSKFWLSVVGGGLALFTFIALIMYACQSGNGSSYQVAPSSGSQNVFGSSTLNANLLNDLEFL